MAKKRFEPCEGCGEEVLLLRKKLKELRKKNRKYKKMAGTDYLTGLPNLQSFYAELVREIARARRRGIELFVVYFDLDHFKFINDTYGHPVGDKVLVKLAEILRTTLRTDDFSARIGGEEFAVIIPATTKKEAVSVMTRLHRKVETNLSVETEKGYVCATASFGYAKVGKREGIDSIIKRVDRALYVAKSAGRNRIHADRQ